MGEHTPWVQGTELHQYAVFDARGEPVADAYGDDRDTVRERARLIAAAPTLLAALEAYQRANRLHHDGDFALHDAAEKAIAAARGTT